MRTGSTLQVVMESLGDQLRFGQSVYEGGGAKLGVIDHVDGDRGWFRVRVRPRPEGALHIPFRLVTRVDGANVFVESSKDDLRRHYGHPPAREIAVEQAGGERFAVTRQANGVDGRSMVVHRVAIDELSGQIGEGYQVLDSEMGCLGVITRYDKTTAWILVQQTVPPHAERLVPLTAVEHVDREYWEVYLTVAESDLERLANLHPVEVVFVGSNPPTAADMGGGS